MFISSTVGYAAIIFLLVLFFAGHYGYHQHQRTKRRKLYGYSKRRR